MKNTTESTFKNCSVELLFEISQYSGKGSKNGVQAIIIARSKIILTADF